MASSGGLPSIGYGERIMDRFVADVFAFIFDPAIPPAGRVAHRRTASGEIFDGGGYSARSFLLLDASTQHRCLSLTLVNDSSSLSLAGAESSAPGIGNSPD